MALQFIDGFDYFNINQLARKWNVSATSFTSLTTGRYGGQAITRTTNSGGSHDDINRDIIARTTIAVGFNFRVNAYGSNGGGEPIYFITQSGAFHLIFQFSTSGILSVKNAGTTVVLATASTAIPVGSWYFLEFLATIASGTLGSVAAYQDGNLLMSNNACNTYGGSGIVGCDRISLGVLGYGSVSFTYDDLYILDNTGSANTTRRGPSAVTTFYPAGVGASSAWIPNGSVNGYGCVAEHPADDDTTYTSASGSGQVDLYTPGPVVTVGAGPVVVYGVQASLVSRYDDAGPHSIADEVRSGGTTYDGPTQSLTASYKNYIHVWETDPATSVPWTVSGMSAAQFGQKAVS